MSLAANLTAQFGKTNRQLLDSSADDSDNNNLNVALDTSKYQPFNSSNATNAVDSEEHDPEYPQYLQQIMQPSVAEESTLDGLKKQGHVVIIGAGVSGLTAAYHLKRLGVSYEIIEASNRIGGRVKTIEFAPGLHGEGGAMRIPKGHALHFKMMESLTQQAKDHFFEPFPMQNHLLHLTQLNEALTVEEFDQLVKDKAQCLMDLYPNLKFELNTPEDTKAMNEKTLDDAWNTSVLPIGTFLMANVVRILYPGVEDKALDDLTRVPTIVLKERNLCEDELKNAAAKELFDVAYNNVVNADRQSSWYAALKQGYEIVCQHFDHYTFKTFLKACGWSADQLTLFELSQPHIGFANGFLEAWKDAFLSSNAGTDEVDIYQYKDGFCTLPNLLYKKVVNKNDIRFNSRVVGIKYHPSNCERKKVEIVYQEQGNHSAVAPSPSSSNNNIDSVFASHIICTIPLPVLRTVKFQPQIDNLHLSAILNVQYQDSTKVLLHFNKRFWESKYYDKTNTDNLLQFLPQDQEEYNRVLKNLRTMHNGGGIVTDLAMRYASFASPHAKRCQNTQDGIVMASYTLDRDAAVQRCQPPQFTFQMILDDFKTLFGEKLINYCFVNGDYAIQAWGNEQYCGGAAFASWSAGQRLEYLDGMRKPVKNFDQRLVFVGEHCSYQHGWVEGAIESALYAIHTILPFGQ